ncbi:MAG: hypothetical protein RL283_757 [Actinomycetota bacterium]
MADEWEYREPYFLPATADRFLGHGETWVENNQRFRQSQKFQFFRNVIDYLIDNDLKGSYFEFGVHRARTFTMAMSLDRFYADRKGPTGGALAPHAAGGYFDEYVAFDSFEGFPDETAVHEHPIYKSGHVKTNEVEFLELLRRYGQSTDRVRLVKGFYDRSLTESLAAEFRSRRSVASFVTVDCNLYESYRDVLTWCDEFIQPGTIIYLDDFNTHRAQDDRGPRRAWTEYIDRARWTFDRFLDVGWCGRSYVAQRRS